MGIDLSPLEKNGLQEYRESLFVIDPNPNPIGFGLLFFVTFWPAVICLGVGFFQSRRGS